MALVAQGYSRDQNPNGVGTHRQCAIDQVRATAECWGRTGLRRLRRACAAGLHLTSHPTALTRTSVADDAGRRLPLCGSAIARALPNRATELRHSTAWTTT